MNLRRSGSSGSRTLSFRSAPTLGQQIRAGSLRSRWTVPHSGPVPIVYVVSVMARDTSSLNVLALVPQLATSGLPWPHCLRSEYPNLWGCGNTLMLWCAAFPLFGRLHVHVSAASGLQDCSVIPWRTVQTVDLPLFVHCGRDVCCMAIETRRFTSLMLTIMSKAVMLTVTFKVLPKFPVTFWQCLDTVLRNHFWNE